MTRRVILAGGGHAHLAVLADWARKPLAGTTRMLVTSSRHTIYSGMVPGWMAGIYRTRETLIDLVPLAEQAGAELIIADIVGLEPEGRVLTLSNGQTVPYDLLSLATGGQIDTDVFDAFRGALLPIRPMDSFMQRWSAILQDSAPRLIAVVGGGAAGIELALGADMAMRTAGRRGAVRLVTAVDGLLTGHAPGVRRLVLDELARRQIAIHFGHAIGAPDGLILSTGERIAGDCVIVATGSRAQPWLASSGVASDTDGFVLVGAEMRSVSHPAIFAAGDIASRADRQLARSGVHAVKAGPVLAANLRAVIEGRAGRPYQPSDRTLYLLSLGDQRAIASWRRFAASGRMAWWLKDRIDRRFVRQYA